MTTNASLRRPVPAVAHSTIPPISNPAVPGTDAPAVQILEEAAPLVSVVTRATHPGNTIVGRVTFNPPPERVIALNTDPSCPALRTNPPTTQDFIVGTNGALANVFVSLAGRMSSQLSAASLTNHLLTLADCKITPLLSGALVSQAWIFSNHTTEDHLLRIVTTNHPSAPNNRITSQVVLYSGLARTRPAARRPEDFIAIECSKHPWEFAYVCAVENPFFAVSDTNGVFVIPNVPTGKYLLNARHLKMSGANALAREVVVKADQPTEVDFIFDLAPNP
ncbi:MAG: carboxypeptidase-like regulatory domain-containing protein [Verrucomicrobiota bacterium]